MSEIVKETFEEFFLTIKKEDLRPDLKVENVVMPIEEEECRCCCCTSDCLLDIDVDSLSDSEKRAISSIDLQQLTSFVISTNTYDENIIKDIENICDGVFSPVAPSYTNNIYYSTGGTPIKWNKHEEDMKNLSKKYPDIEFKLEGSNEHGSYWDKYFLNGQLIGKKPTK